MDTWIQGGGHTVTSDLDSQTGQQVVRFRFGAVPPTDEWSVGIGDCVHNLRSALDHLVFELAETSTGRPLPDSIAQKSEFPIFGIRAPHANELSDKIGGLHPDARTLIEGLQPYKMGAGYERHALWTLHRLANIDKHRTIHTAVFSQMGGGLTGSNFKLTETTWRARALQDGAELVRYKAVPLDPQKKMEVKFIFPLFVTFQEGPPAFGERVIPLLREISRYVEEHIVGPLSVFL